MKKYFGKPKLKLWDEFGKPIATACDNPKELKKKLNKWLKKIQ